MKKIEELIDKSEYPTIQKNIMKGFVLRANEETELRNKDRELIEKVGRENKVSEIILSTDNVKIYTVSGKKEWDIKYPFRSIYLNSEGVWVGCHTVSPSLDTAYLVYLEKKYLGENSQFTDFTLKMLGIKIEE